MASSLPPLSTFFGLSPNFLDGPASISSRINLLLYGSSSQLVPIQITNFGINLPPILGAPLNGGGVFEFPPIMINTMGSTGVNAGPPVLGGPSTGTQTGTGNTNVGNNANTPVGSQGVGGTVNTPTGVGGTVNTPIGVGNTQLPGVNNGAPSNLTGLGGIGTDTSNITSIFGNNMNGLLGIFGGGNLPATGTGGTVFFAPGNGFSNAINGQGGTVGVAGTSLVPLNNSNAGLFNGNNLSGNAGTQALILNTAALPNTTGFNPGVVSQNPQGDISANRNLSSLLALSGINSSSSLARLF